MTCTNLSLQHWCMETAVEQLSQYRSTFVDVRQTIYSKSSKRTAGYVIQIHASQSKSNLQEITLGDIYDRTTFAPTIISFACCLTPQPLCSVYSHLSKKREVRLLILKNNHPPCTFPPSTFIISQIFFPSSTPYSLQLLSPFYHKTGTMGRIGSTSYQIYQLCTVDSTIVPYA